MEKKIDKLKLMLGKKFAYEGEEISLLTYKQTGEKIEIITDKDWIHTTIFDLDIEISKMKEVQLPAVSLKEIYMNNTKFVSIKNDSIDKVQDTLLEMMERVKADRDNIDQASSIVQIANQVIATEKLKLEQIVMLNKLQQL